jgi:hypothetical protein
VEKIVLEYNVVLDTENEDETFLFLLLVVANLQWKRWRKNKTERQFWFSVVDTGSDVKLKLKVKIIHFKKQDVSHWIYNTLKDDFSKILIIFPNKRSVSQLENHAEFLQSADRSTYSFQKFLYLVLFGKPARFETEN